MKDDPRLLEWLQARAETSEAYVQSQVWPGRQSALDEYHRRGYEGDDELIGRSSIVMSDVLEAVEWTLPQLVEMFAAKGRIVRFDPRRPDAVEKAEQLTEAVNYVFWTQNNGIQLLSEGIRHILTQGEAAASWSIDEQIEKRSETYSGLTDMELLFYEQQGAKVKIVEEGVGQDDLGNQFPLYTAQVEYEVSDPKVCVEAHDPGYLIIDSDWSSPSLEKCPYVGLLKWQSLSDLKEAGFDIDPEMIDDTLPYFLTDTAGERISRYQNRDSQDTATLCTWVRYEWVLFDKDGNGVVERLRVVRIGDTMIACDPVDQVEVCQGIAVSVAGTPYGQSLNDLMGPQQMLHSSIMRIMLDSAYFQTEPRMIVLHRGEKPMANMESVLDHRSSAPIEEYEPGAVRVLEQRWIGNDLMPLLDYVQSQREQTSGVTKLFTGQDANALNKTATGVAMQDQSARSRITLMGRMIAETYVKPIMRGIARLLLSGEAGPIMLRLNKQFVQIDPSEWEDEFDMVCEVGLGTGDDDQRRNVMAAVIQQQGADITTGALDRSVTLRGLYNARAEWLEVNNVKNAGDFFLDPDGDEAQMIAQAQANQPPPPPDPVLELEKARLEIQRANQESKVATDRAKLDLDAWKVEYESRAKRDQAEMIERMRASTQEELQAMRNDNAIVVQAMRDDTARLLEDLRQDSQMTREYLRQIADERKMDRAQEQAREAYEPGRRSAGDAGQPDDESGS